MPRLFLGLLLATFVAQQPAPRARVQSPSLTPSPSSSLTLTRTPSPSLTLAPSPSLTRTPSPSLTLAPCEWGNTGGRIECGTLTVPEDRARPDGRSIQIFLVVARATGAVAGDPVFFFTGGPGTAATAITAVMSHELAELRASRDFVFIDQRGTGRSAPLACPDRGSVQRRLSKMFDRAEAAMCREALEAAADLRFYGTADAVLDAEDVRRVLGYRRINLHGSSYGTRTAWAYAARFPSRARAMLLHGPVPPGFYTPLPFGRALDAALAGVIDGCKADRACASRFPALAEDVARAFARVRGRPVRVRLREAGGQPVVATITHGELTEAVRYQLYTAAAAANLPLLLTRAAKGDYAPLANAALDMRARFDRQLTRGMYLSVTCAEDIPLMAARAVREESAGTRLGEYRVRQQIEACREWPRGAAPAAAFYAPVRTPALVQVGEFDPATSPEWARRGMALLPNGRLTVIPNAAHSFASLGIDGCLAQIATAFFTRGSAQDLDTSCVDAARRPPFTLR